MSAARRGGDEAVVAEFIALHVLDGPISWSAGLQTTVADLTRAMREGGARAAAINRARRHYGNVAKMLSSGNYAPLLSVDSSVVRFACPLPDERDVEHLLSPDTYARLAEAEKDVLAQRRRSAK